MNPWIITILCSEFLTFPNIMLHVSCRNRNRKETEKNCFFFSVIFVRFIYECVIHGVDIQLFFFFFLNSANGYVGYFKMFTIPKYYNEHSGTGYCLRGGWRQWFPIFLPTFINITVQRREPIWLGGWVSQPTCSPLRHMP